MKYTRNINALLLLCAMHMHAMEKEIVSSDGKISVSIAKNHQSILVKNHETKQESAIECCKGRFKSIDEFVNNNTAIAAIVVYADGIDPEHMHSKEVREIISLNTTNMKTGSFFSAVWAWTTGW